MKELSHPLNRQPKSEIYYLCWTELNSSSLGLLVDFL